MNLQGELVKKAPSKKKMTAARVLSLLMEELNYKGWIQIPEFRLMAGYGYYADKKVDLYTIRDLTSRRNERVAYEIKVSRSDFTRELGQPTKRYSAMLFSNRFYFVAPVGMIKVKELPIDCGLVEVGEDGVLTWKKKAPWRESLAPTWPFVTSLIGAVRREN